MQQVSEVSFSIFTLYFNLDVYSNYYGKATVDSKCLGVLLHVTTICASLMIFVVVFSWSPILFCLTRMIC